MGWYSYEVQRFCFITQTFRNFGLSKESWNRRVAVREFAVKKLSAKFHMLIELTTLISWGKSECCQMHLQVDFGRVFLIQKMEFMRARS
jgi:hypothetical protein